MIEIDGEFYNHPQWTIIFKGPLFYMYFDKLFFR